jgi:hypothetical protein
MAAIHLENCRDATIQDCHSIDCAVGLSAINCTGLRATGNVFALSVLPDAIARRDSPALLEYMNIPKRTPSNLVQEAIDRLASNFPDANAAVADLQRSRLVEFLGPGANVTAIVTGVFQVIRAGALATVRSIVGH